MSTIPSSSCNNSSSLAKKTEALSNQNDNKPFSIVDDVIISGNRKNDKSGIYTASDAAKACGRLGKVGSVLTKIGDKIGDGIVSAYFGVSKTSKDLIDKVGDTFSRKENGPGMTDDIKDKESVARLEQYPEYLAVLEARYQDADPLVKALYDKYEKYIKVSNVEAYGTARYCEADEDITVYAIGDTKSKPKGGNGLTGEE